MSYEYQIIVLLLIAAVVMAAIAGGFCYEAGVRHGQRQRTGTWADAAKAITSPEPTLADEIVDNVAAVAPLVQPVEPPVVDRPPNVLRPGRHRFEYIAEPTRAMRAVKPTGERRNLVAA